MLRIGIVAGEPSGDNLGADLIRSIKSVYGDVELEGIGGEMLITEGCKSLYPMERLSVMGLFEIASRYFELLKMQKQIKQYFLDNPPDVFIGIDAPEFNLSIEHCLRQANIRTVHYVSPSVWAWRKSRLKKIAKSVDLMLTLFPFEERYYQEHNVPVQYVGHPLARNIPMQTDSLAARQVLDPDLTKNDRVLVLLPGSRSGEIKRLTEPFIKAAKIIKKQFPDLTVVVALRDEKSKVLFQSMFEQCACDLEFQIVIGKTQTALAAADVVLLASGTATLETLLMKKPMVVAYRANWLTYKIINSMLTVPFVSLPNLIAGEKIVPECLQSECQPDKLAVEVLKYFENEDQTEDLRKRFCKIHESLLETEDNPAAKAVMELLP